jgi:putative membrane protein
MNAIGGGLQGIQAGIGSAMTEGTLLYATSAVIAGTDDILAGLQTMIAGLGTTAAAGTILGTLNAIAKSCDTASAPGSSGLFGQTALAYGTTQALRAALPSLGLTPLQLGTIDGYLAGIESELYNAIYSVSPPGIGYIDVALSGSIIPGLQGIKGGMQDMVEGIGSPSTPGTALYALSAIYGGLSSIANGIGSATSPDTLLYAVQAVEIGLNNIKGGIGDAGIPDTLLFALAAMQNGLTQIKAGLSSGDMNSPAIKEGLMLISAGIGDAVTGLGSSGTPDTLLYGTNAVAEGLTELGGGATQLEEGLGAVLSGLSMTDAQLEAIALRGEEFDHFLGRAEDAESQVRFVYQSKPTYNYEEGSSTSWIVAIVLSILIALGLVAGGILLARKSTA